MEENINESAEIQEVAEPETDVSESAETQEVAEPAPEESHEEPEKGERTEADAAFAEQRRTIQALERDNQLMREALLRYFDGETAEELSINANAYAEQRDPDEYRQEFERNREYEQLKADKASLEEQLLNIEVERLMSDGLRDIQAIDPTVKSLDELGESFAKFIEAGLTSTEAYWATMAQKQKEKVFAPDAIGRVSETKAERDYFTSEELDNLTDEELNDDKIWEKVMRSMGRL